MREVSAKRLDEVFRVGSSKRILKSQWQSEGVPFYRGREITKLSTDGFVNNELFISETDYAEYASKSGVPVPGDIVITAIGTIGNSYVVRAGDRFYFKDASVLWLKKLGTINSQYTNLWLKSPQFFEQLDKGNGATVDTLIIKKLQSVLIPLPPLTEQERIVAILDKAFAAIETATANTEKNLANAKELFESELNRVFSQKGEGWVEKTLGGVYDVRDGTHDSPRYHNEGYPLITSKNLKHEGLNFDKVKFISEEDFKKINQRSAVHKGDVLFAMIGTIGNPTVVNVEPEFAIKNVALFKLGDQQDSSFLKYYLRSAMVVTKMRNEAKGTTQKFVGLGYLRGFPICVPGRDVQRLVVAELDALLERTNRLEASFHQKLTALAELKQSFLQKAFSGELTADAKAADRTLSEAGV